MHGLRSLPSALRSSLGDAAAPPPKAQGCLIPLDRPAPLRVDPAVLAEAVAEAARALRAARPVPVPTQQLEREPEVRPAEMGP
jgi:hypothetical protein